jgi:hypothetical protein
MSKPGAINSGDQVILYYPGIGMSINSVDANQSGGAYNLLATNDKISSFILPYFKIIKVTCDAETILTGPVTVDSCIILTTTYLGQEYIVDASGTDARLIPYNQNFPLTTQFQIFSTSNNNSESWTSAIFPEEKMRHVTSGSNDLLILARNRELDLLNVQDGNVKIGLSQNVQGTVMSLYKYSNTYSICCGSGGSTTLPTFCSCTGTEGNVCLNANNIMTPDCVSYCGSESDKCAGFLTTFCADKKAGSQYDKVCGCLYPTAQYPILKAPIQPQIGIQCTSTCLNSLVKPTAFATCNIKNICLVNLDLNLQDVSSQIGGGIKINQNCGSDNPLTSILDFIKNNKLYIVLGVGIFIIIVLVILILVI